MVEDLNIPIRIETCETIREPDGLAMSSRNQYLSPEERQRALSLSRALNKAEELVAGGERDAGAIESAMIEQLQAGPVDKIDYAKVVDAETLEPVSIIHSLSVAILAARLGATRLIDNSVLIPNRPEKS
jgi:pantoate--beta-alanine ligase